MQHATGQYATGQCLCGSLRFQITLPVRWLAHCHCSMCRRGHGAAFVTWFGVVPTACQVLQGELIWYRSSPEAERGRCATCGSPLFFRSQRWPDELHIVLAALDAPIAQTPQLHVYYGNRVDWVDLADHLPRYATVPSQDGAPLTV